MASVAALDAAVLAAADAVDARDERPLPNDPSVPYGHQHAQLQHRSWAGWGSKTLREGGKVRIVDSVDRTVSRPPKDQIKAEAARLARLKRFRKEIPRYEAMAQLLWPHINLPRNR